ncbi:MAG: YkvA family protein [Hyphomonadaceae bacterium]
MSQYSRAYSEQTFKAKVNSLGALKDLVDAAKRIHAIMRDPATPIWVKGVCVAALGYLILPTDAVTDFIPVLGHGDDLAMLTAALSAIAAHWNPDRASVVASEE